MAIAGHQTGIYPIESPGGWRVIGRTPLDMLADSSDSPFLLDSGNDVRFVPITRETFEDLSLLTTKPEFIPKEWARYV